ncbi:MAG: ABC transporter permease [Pyrinomonadaceae bacterium]
MEEVRKIERKKRRRWTLIAGLTTVALFYFVAIFADFFSPYDRKEQSLREPSAPPSTLRFSDQHGVWGIRPFIYGQRLVDARNVQYEEVADQKYPIYFFTEGHAYTLLGVYRTNIHLFGIESAGDPTAPKVRLLGTDQIGRDRFSRLLHAIRFSLLVSPIGTILACLIGMMFGLASGYANATIDGIMMSVADTMISLPTLILILAARAAFPLELPPLTAAWLLVMIFAFTGWAEMARLARGLVFSMRNREFVTAARAIGLSEPRILWRHILPNIAGPLLVQATLMLPVFFLAEISLSFLGVGLQEPEPSLGNMLAAAVDLSKLSATPFVLLSPGIAIFLFVLGVRLIGWTREPAR